MERFKVTTTRNEILCDEIEFIDMESMVDDYRSIRMYKDDSDGYWAADSQTVENIEIVDD